MNFLVLSMENAMMQERKKSITYFVRTMMVTRIIKKPLSGG